MAKTLQISTSWLLAGFPGAPRPRAGEPAGPLDAGVLIFCETQLLGGELVFANQTLLGLCVVVRHHIQDQLVVLALTNPCSGGVSVGVSMIYVNIYGDMLTYITYVDISSVRHQSTCYIYVDINFIILNINVLMSTYDIVTIYVDILYTKREST